MAVCSKRFLQVILVALLFQFAWTACVALAVQGSVLGMDTRASLHARHNSLVIPQLLKEKDETEKADEDLIIDFIALIDFTDHSSVLTKSHESKLTPFPFPDRIDHHPPLFTLYRVFII